jgi:hypothetical protein
VEHDTDSAISFLNDPRMPKPDAFYFQICPYKSAKHCYAALRILQTYQKLGKNNAEVSIFEGPRFDAAQASRYALILHHDTGLDVKIFDPHYGLYKSVPKSFELH